MNPDILAWWDGQEVPLLCRASDASCLPGRGLGRGHGKGSPTSALAVCAPLLGERQMRSAPVVSRNSSATGSNKTGAAGPGRAGSVKDPGLLPWAQEPGSHQGPQSLLPRTWRPDVFLAWVVSRGPGEGPWGKGAHAQSKFPLPHAPPFLPLLSQLLTS